MCASQRCDAHRALKLLHAQDLDLARVGDADLGPLSCVEFVACFLVFTLFSSTVTRHLRRAP